MTIRYALCAAIALAALAPGCSDDAADGDGEDDDDGGGQTLEPGREVSGCFDCAEAEYCIILVGDGTESYRCAEADCGLGCTCIIADGEKRHAECSSHSCQEGASLLYCG